MAAGSFSAGLSGLNANAEYLRVIGNNLANINTIGFKASQVSFSDLVSQTLGSPSVNPAQIGLGVVTGSITPVFNQGAIENTHEATNAAIQGAGFFVLNGPGGRTFTRAGNFTLDSSGKLVTPDGYAVQGYTQTDSQGNIVTTGQPTDLVVPPGVLRPPTATTTFRTVTNLYAGATTGSTFATSVQVYDPLGASHVATITYTKAAAAETWTYAVTVPGAEITGGTSGTPYTLGTGTVVFNSSGVLSTVNGAAPADVAITTPTWTNGAAANSLVWDIVDANSVASLTGFAAPSATSSISQGGSAPGQVIGVTITSNGVITATFGAGQAVAVGQLALGSFNNPKGLVKVGSNQYGESQAAGIANIGTAGTGGRGTLIGNALEGSNVDIASEFTQMIVAQRGYQASAKSITVSDELLVDTLNLKR